MHSYSTASSVSSSSRRRPRPGTEESSNLRTPLPSSWSSTASIASSSAAESTSGMHSYQQRRSRRPALILDASVSSVASEPPPSTAAAPLVASPDPENSTNTARRRLWPNWTGGRRALSTTTHDEYQTPMAKKEDHQHGNYRSNNVTDEEEPYNPLETAAHFSRHATTAGYLTKLDSQTQQHWKRRFCVLQPATHLYYFWSPTDTEPRGCCHVDDAKVSMLAPLPDGRTRIVLEWDNLHEHAAGDGGSNGSTPHRVLLEARSPDVAQAWHEALTTQSYTHVRQARDDLRRQYATAVKALREAQQKATAFQSDAVEANHAAAQRKADLQALDEGVRQLTQRLTTTVSTKTSEDDTKGPETKVDPASAEGQSGNVVDDDAEIPSSPLSKQSSSPSPIEPRDTSLLDQSLGEGGQNDSIDAAWDPQSVPGPSFAALHQVCTQLQEHVRWANLEAQTAVQDAHTAQLEVQRLSKRGAAAEAQLLQMWEENCALRKSLQHKKREKKVLVREVRKLQAAAATAGANESPAESSENAAEHATEENEEEDQLMEELEAHVMSSIRLHEQIMAATPKSSSVNLSNSQTSQTAKLSSNQVQTRLHVKKSLLDDFSSDDEDEDDESIDDEVPPGFPDVIPSEDASSRGEIESISSVQVEGSVAEESVSSLKPHQESAVSARASSVASTSSPNPTLARPNPIIQLDALEQAPPAAMTPVQQSTTSVLQAEATSNLASSLTKATDRMRMPESSRTEATDDLQVYHLTFYSRKIGLQFQKVPPPPAKPKGLLTDAVKADFMENFPENKPDRTTTELRMIASLSHHAKIEAGDEKKGSTTTLQAPVDAVLVCGFNGFNESGANVRPKLGARLVAFDGVSVEVGRWTFDSIRKAILSRSRPLTLSFRNDYLTMEQREILTRAVKEANHYNTAARRQSGTTADVSSDLPSSAQSTTSHESGSFVNQNVVVSVMKHPGSDRHEMDSVSVMTERSMGPETPLPATPSAAPKRTPYSFRSFSDVGSSTSSVLSAVGPLMAHLLPPRTPSEPFTPDYMVSKGQSVEETPEHADFASSLL